MNWGRRNQTSQPQQNKLVSRCLHLWNKRVLTQQNTLDAFVDGVVLEVPQVSSAQVSFMCADFIVRPGEGASAKEQDRTTPAPGCKILSSAGGAVYCSVALASDFSVS